MARHQTPDLVSKFSVSLSPQSRDFVEQYQKTHGLSRSEVINRAIQALREQELAEGYRALAREYAEAPDPLLDAGIADGLEPSTEDTW